MSDEAKILDASDTVTVRGKQYQLAALDLRQLISLQQEAFRAYKRDYLQTYSDTVKLLHDDPDVQRTMLSQKIDEVSRWTAKSMPRVLAYSVAHAELNAAMRSWCEATYSLDPKKTTDSHYRGLLTTALDSGSLSAEQFAEMAHVEPRRGLVPYEMWWVTGSYEGMVSFVTASIRRHDTTIREQEVMDWSLPDLIYSARRIESMTEPSAGNSAG